MKKVISALGVIILVLMLAVPCFASQVYYDNIIFPVYPSRADAYPNYIIFDKEDDSGYYLLNFSRYNGDGRYLYWIIYKYIGTGWTQVDAWSITQTGYGDKYPLNDNQVIYDSTGRLMGKGQILYESEDFASVLNKAMEQITVANVVQLLVVCCTAIVGLVFMWWGVRKLSRALLKAFRKGRVSV